MSSIVSRPARGVRSRTDRMVAEHAGESVYLTLFALAVATLWIYAWVERANSLIYFSPSPIVSVEPAAPGPVGQAADAGRP